MIFHSRIFYKLCLLLVLCLFLTQVANTDNVKEERKEIVIDQNVDAVYKNAGNVNGHLVSTSCGNVKIEKSYLPDTGK